MDLIGEALVKIRPDLTGIRFQIQSEIAGALAGLKLGTAASSISALAGATNALAATQLGLAGHAIKAADAEGTLAVALRAAGIAANSDAAATVKAATANITLATSARTADAAVAASAASTGKSARGLTNVANQSNIARGALIGLARVTPVAVFGLGIAGTAAIAAAIGFRSAISSAADFEQQLNIFRVVSEATGEQMTHVSEVAKELGRDITLPGVSAGDAAAGLTELSKAGVSVTDSVEGIRGVLQLGTAANIDFGTSAQIAASALNAFDLPGRRASDVADLLAASSIAAQGEITDMAQALTQSAAVAKQANISIEDTVTAISLLAKNGLLGSDAGTSLRTTILRLVPTTKEAATFVHALGIEFEDAEGKLRPLPVIFENYRQVLSKLPPVLQQAALQQIFGQDAIRAASILAREGAAGFSEMAKEVTREGVAAEVAGARTAGFSGAVSALSSSLETLGIIIGGVLLPPLGLLVGALTAVTNAVIALDTAPGAGSGSRFFKFIAGMGRVDTTGLAGDLEDLRGEIDKIGNTRGKFGTPFGKLGEDDARQLGIELNIAQLSVLELRDLFANSSSLIGKALKDGVIDPLEVIEFRTTEAGRAFLSGFAAPGSAILPTVRAVKVLEEQLGRLPEESEVRVVLRSDTFAAGVREVTNDAFRAGTLLADSTIDGFGAGLSVEKTAGSGRFLVDGLASLTPEANAAGKQVAAGFGDGFVDEIDATERRAIDAARRALGEAVEAAEEQVQAAVFAARDNLTELGNSLNQQIATLIDTSPIAQKIAELQGQLDSLQDRGQKRRLGQDLRDAQAELAEARSSIGAFEFTTPEQQREVDEFLRPFVRRVQDAKAAKKEFDLSDTIEGLEDTQQAAKDAAQLGLANLIQRFKDGKVSAGDFQKLLSQQLQPAIDTLNTKAGKNLGLTFTSEFFQNVSNLRDQVRELVGFLGITGPSPEVTRPGQVQAEGAERVAEARRNLNQTIEDARTTAESTSDASGTLKRIERLLRAQSPASPGGAVITPAEQRGINLASVAR